MARINATNPMGDGVRQLGEFLTGRRFDPAKPDSPIEAVDVHPVKEQHVKVDVEVQRTAKALDQGNRASLGRLVRTARFLDQMRGDDTIDDTKHLPHDCWLAG